MNANARAHSFSDLLQQEFCFLGERLNRYPKLGHHSDSHGHPSEELEQVDIRHGLVLEEVLSHGLKQNHVLGHYSVDKALHYHQSTVESSPSGGIIRQGLPGLTSRCRLTFQMSCFVSKRLIGGSWEEDLIVW